MEIARAREIYGTYMLNKDRDNAKKLVEGSIEWFDENGVKRIYGYLKEFHEGVRE